MKISALWLKSLETGGIEEPPWIGIDLDGSLAYYESDYCGTGYIGDPIPMMMDRVKKWISQGIKVKIFTARASNLKDVPPIQEWLARYGLGGLDVTNIKDRCCIAIYDDRAVQVEKNTGRILGDPSLIEGAPE